ncbi:family 43 glycosylhydrolase [Paenibacillus sp. MMS20-IR301]|uniref:family 43 glycosylhydrolase n=1 Tax=Paenibacillus sp. MMS20-IR301 TaxID=2895946 RepID=UPI0028E3ADCF|nr:family 43 glycosylhydrolase [Paenibacillus sp. MMS20-IR301]WNS40774.1 family 43 glycosylhydrolase [Paenibacillus sp. MMS20-IR301]
MKYVCNPVNMDYKYQFIDYHKRSIAREAADPSLILFKDKYYLFPSMTAGFLASDDLVHWAFHPLKGVPVHDYAPDVRGAGEYIYFSASSKSKNCSFYRTKDPVQGEFEEIPGSFPFWDPNLFIDDDGRMYFYWGCAQITPIYGVELNPEDMQPIGQPAELIFGQPKLHGYERGGDNHTFMRTADNKSDVADEPYIEGAWMDKYNGRYYLQYSSPGTQYNIYSDAVYISDQPLGPFTPAKNNPYSYKPGGFIPGAGHGSTLQDKAGNWWHTSTMRVSVNHPFERRLGLWPAGFDQDGELFCNQRYGDWPMKITETSLDPWSNPEWMLLSYGKPARASSSEKGKEASRATDENVQSWWKAASDQPGEWLEVDLERITDVHAVQINFADDQLNHPVPEGAELFEIGVVNKTKRYIDDRKHVTRWLLEGSVDGADYFVIEDKLQAESNLPHDLVVHEAGMKVRYIRCTVEELPFRQNACISGLRIFGRGEGELPVKPEGIQTRLLSELDLAVTWEKSTAVGHNVLWGFAPDKLYHSYTVFGQNKAEIGALIRGQSLYVRVDAFNEQGITEGDVYGIIE